MTTQAESFYRGTTRATVDLSTLPPFALKVSKTPTLTSGFMTLSPNTVNEEIVFYSGIDATNLTITVTRRGVSWSTQVLNIDGNGTATGDYNNSVYMRKHSQGDQIQSDVNHLHIIQDYVALQNQINTKLAKVGELRTGLGINKIMTTDGSGVETAVDAASIIPVGDNFKNSDFVAGEALSAGNAVVIERFDIQDPRIFTYSAGTPVTSTAGSGSNQGGETAGVYRGMRFSVSSTRVFTGGTLINPSTPPTLWRLLNGSNTVIDSGAFSGNNIVTSSTAIMQAGTQYKIEATHGSVTWTPFGGITGLPVTSGTVTFSNGTTNGSDGGGTFVTVFADIFTAPLVETIAGKNIGDLTANTRIEHAVLGTGVSGNSMTIQIAKILNPGNLGVRIETDNAGNPSGTLADANAVVSIANAGIPTAPGTTPPPPGNVVTYDVTFPGNFSLALNTKYHIVFFQGTYGTETINASNYYTISFTGGYVGTQRSKKWNGSAWSAEASVRKYSASTLFKSIVLAKTNATTTASAYCDGIVESAFTEGQQVTMVIYGQTKSLSGLTERAKYYLSNTPGAISTSAGSVPRAVGTAKQSGLFDIGFYLTT